MAGAAASDADARVPVEAASTSATKKTRPRLVSESHQKIVDTMKEAQAKARAEVKHLRAKLKQDIRQLHAYLNVRFACHPCCCSASIVHGV